MKNESFLKRLVNAIMDNYNQYLVKSSGITVLFTLITFVLVVLLMWSDNSDESSTRRQISILSFFSYMYSHGNTYNLVDLSKIIFAFFVSVFSLGMLRLNKDESDSDEFKFGTFTSNIKINDLITLTGVLVIASICDYIFFKVDSFSLDSIGNDALNRWIHDLNLYLVRVFFPLFLFSIGIYKANYQKKLKVNFRMISYIFISLWLMNGFAYEFSSCIRAYIFNFVMIPFSAESKFLFESFLGIGLMAFYFIGYYTVLTKPLEYLTLEEES